MAYDTRGVLRVEDGEGVRRLTFDRPEVLNAFNQDLWYAAAEALADAADDDTLRCVVVTGAGRSFTSGQDLGEMTDPTVYEDQEPGYQVFMPVLEAFPKPVLAAVNGVAVGIGLTMLMHLDLVLVSTEARLKAPFISLGVTTEASASYLMPATMGWQRASEVLYTERWMSADDAVAMGIALRAVAPERLLDETMEIARHIGGQPLGPLQATKRLLLAGRLDAVQAARERELAEFVTLVREMSTGNG
jgi:enoyl-CoA hydratase/carnithine racemase